MIGILGHNSVLLAYIGHGTTWANVYMITQLNIRQIAIPLFIVNTVHTN